VRKLRRHQRLQLDQPPFGEKAASTARQISKRQSVNREQIRTLSPHAIASSGGIATFVRRDLIS
jgi:hypothetical protein